MKEDENEINLEAKHLNILPKGNPVNLEEFLKKFESSDKIASKESLKLASGGAGRIFDKAISGLIYSLIFFLPLFILPFSMEIYEFNKTFLLFIFSSLAFLLWIIKMVLIDKRLTFVRTPLDMPIIIFISLILISTAFSVDKVSSVLGFYGRFSDSLMVYLSLAMLYFVVVNFVYRRRHIDISSSSATDSLLKAFLVSALIVVISALLYFFGFKFIPWQEAQFRSFNLVAESANILGIYLVAVILIALGYRDKNSRPQAPFSKSDETPLFKNLMSALIIMSIILLAIIDFAASWIVLAISLIMAVILKLFIQKRAYKNIFFTIPFLIIIISIIFIVSSLTAINKNANSNFSDSSISNSIKNRILPAEEVRKENDKFTKEIVLDKKTAISVAVKGLKNDQVAGIIGSGPGTYLYDFSKFKPAEFNNSVLWNVRFDKAGSEILEKISTIGIFGVLSYLAIIFLMIAMFLKIISGKNKITIINIYLFAAWLSLLLFQFIYLSGTVVAFTFWLFTAILAAEYYNIIQQNQSDNNDLIINQMNCFSLDLKKEGKAIYLYLFASAVLSISFFAFYYYQIRFYQAEAAYKNISVKQNKILDRVDLDNQKIGEILNQKADDIKRKVIEKNPYRGEYKAYLSDIYLQKTAIAFQEEMDKKDNEKNTQKIAEEAKNAIDYFKDAADSNPNNIIFQHKMGSTYFIAARDLGVAGADGWAIKKFNRAIELEPTNPVLYTELGKIFFLTDQVDLAINEFQKALDYKADYIDAGLQLSLAYEKKEEKQKAIDTLNSMGSVERIQNVIAAGQIITSANLDIDIAFQLGRIYYNAGKVFLAKDIFTKIIKINPSHSNAHYSLGLIYSSEGSKEKSLKEFETVLLLNPENEDVKNRIDELKKGVDGNANANTNAPKEINNSEENMIQETVSDAEEENIGSETR